MNFGVLEYLRSDELHRIVGFTTSASVLRRVLQKAEGVIAVDKAIRRGEMTEPEVRTFVSTLMEAFEPGKRLPDESAPAALAVALEHQPTDFAEEYLTRLAGLRYAEMGIAPAVARECLKSRCLLPKNEVRTARYAPRPAPPRTTLTPCPGAPPNGDAPPRVDSHERKYAETS